MIGLHFWRLSIQQTGMWICTLLETNISPEKSILKMIFLFPRWDMLISWRVTFLIFIPENWGFMIQLDYSNLFQIGLKPPSTQRKITWGFLGTPACLGSKLSDCKFFHFFWNAFFWKPLVLSSFGKKTDDTPVFFWQFFFFFGDTFFCFNTWGWDLKKAPKQLW